MQKIMATHFDALAVQASEAGRLLRRRQRGGGTRSRAGSSIRCTGARTCSTTACRNCRARATAIATAPTWSCAGYGEAIFPVEVVVVFKNGERVTEQWDGTDRWKLYSYERPVQALVGAGRSEPRAAARRELHEQLDDARATRRRGRDQVVADVDGLAAGLPAVVGGAGMRGLARRHPPRQQRAGAPRRRLGADAARQRADGGGDARHAGAASRPEPRRRHRGERRQLRLDAGIRRSGRGPRRHLQADDHRLRRSARQPQRLPRQHSTDRSSSSPPRSSTSCCGSSWPAASSIATRATGRRDAIGFFAASGVFFFRFLRLAVVQWLVYAAAVRLAAPAACSTGSIRGSSTTSRGAHGVRDSRRRCTSSSACVVAACATVFDYAKVRAVVEDRRSMISAIVEAIRLRAAERGRGRRAVPGLNFGLFLAAVGMYAVIAPPVGGTGPSMWMAFAIGQFYRGGAAVGEAGVLGVRDGAVPEPAGARRLCQPSRAEVAGVARGGGDLKRGRGNSQRLTRGHGSNFYFVSAVPCVVKR